MLLLICGNVSQLTLNKKKHNSLILLHATAYRNDQLLFQQPDDVHCSQSIRLKDGLSLPVSLSYILMMKAGVRHKVLYNRANQIVVRNSQSPLRTAERREDQVAGGGKTQRGFFTWWHSEIDRARSPHGCLQFCVWALPRLFTYSTSLTQGYGNCSICGRLSSQYDDGEVWNECVCESLEDECNWSITSKNLLTHPLSSPDNGTAQRMQQCIQDLVANPLEPWPHTNTLHLTTACKHQSVYSTCHPSFGKTFLFAPSSVQRAKQTQPCLCRILQFPQICQYQSPSD